MKIKLGMLCLLMCVFVGAMKEEDSDQKKQLNEELASRVNAQWKKAEEKQLKEELQLMVPIHAEGAVEPDLLDIGQNEMRQNAVLENLSKKGAPSQTIVITSTEGQVQGSDAGKKFAYKFIYHYSQSCKGGNEYICDKDDSNNGFIVGESNSDELFSLQKKGAKWVSKSLGAVAESIHDAKDYDKVPVNGWSCQRKFYETEKNGHLEKIIECKKGSMKFEIRCYRKRDFTISDDDVTTDFNLERYDHYFFISFHGGELYTVENGNTKKILTDEVIMSSFFIKNSGAKGWGIVDFCTDGENIFMVTNRNDILHYTIAVGGKNKKNEQQIVVTFKEKYNTFVKEGKNIYGIAYSREYDYIIVGFQDGSLKALYRGKQTASEKYNKRPLLIECDTNFEKPIYDIVFNRDESYILLASRPEPIALNYFSPQYAIYQVEELSNKPKKIILEDPPKKQTWTWKKLLTGTAIGSAIVGGGWALYKYLTTPKKTTTQNEEE